VALAAWAASEALLEMAAMAAWAALVALVALAGHLMCRPVTEAEPLGSLDCLAWTETK